MTVLATVLTSAAQTSAALAGGSNSSSTLNDVEPGLFGVLVVAGLGIVLVFLLRSMNKQLRKIGPGPSPAETEAEGASEPASRRPLRGLAAHRAALAAAEANPDPADAERD